MRSTYYEQYLKAIYQFCKTIVIKSEATAIALNTDARLRGITVSETRPTTWRYYLNLSGVYHTLDQPMYINSQDTLQRIRFDKTTLQSHPLTKRQLTLNSDGYKDLIYRYPAQELLIRGILNPIDVETAVSAPDHTILFHDTQHIEPNEQTLISGIQDRVFRWFDRWSIPEYALTDDLYTTAQLGVFYAHLPNIIVNERSKRIRTEEAHSFHMRQYIGGFNNLDVYFDHMTFKQRMFLYRNLDFIRGNVGRNETFEELVKIFMTESNLPLANYVMVHNNENLLSDFTPTVQFERRSVNGLPCDVGKDIVTTEELLDIERDVFIGNSDDPDDDAVKVKNRFKHAYRSIIKTKVFESAITDTTLMSPYPRLDIAVNYWFKMSLTGKYTARRPFTNPKDGSSTIISARTGVVIYLYAYNRAMGNVLTSIPKLHARRVFKETKPTLSSLRGMTTSLPPDLLAGIWNNWLSTPTTNDAEVFKSFCAMVFSNMGEHHLMVHAQREHRRRLDAQVACDALYESKLIPSSIYGDDIIDWLRSRGVDIYDMSKDDYQNVYRMVFETFTGISLDNPTELKELHRAMVGVLRELSSYTVQFIERINDGDVRWFQHGKIRQDKTNISMDTTVHTVRRERIQTTVAHEDLRPSGSHRIKRIGLSFEYNDNLSPPYQLSRHRLTTCTELGVNGSALLRRQAGNTVQSNNQTNLIRTTITYIDPRKDVLEVDAYTAFFKAVNRGLGTTFNPYNLSYSVTGSSQATTKVKLTPIDGSPLPVDNEVTVNVTRMSLQPLALYNAPIELPANTNTIIGALNAIYGFKLDPSEFVMRTYSTTNAVLWADPSSIRFYGSVTVILQ